jgi:outer membrane protein TolC
VVLALAERRAALVDSNAVFAERLAQSARRQLDAGEVNRLEYNAAVLESARARSAAERAGGRREAAAANLARLLALGPDSVPKTAPLPPVPELRAADEARLLSVARSRRPDLAAAVFETEAAKRALSLAHRSLIPNLTFSIFSGREEATDDLFGFSVGLSIPLFRRRQADVGAARAGHSIARAEAAAIGRLLEAEVRSAAARYARAASAERRFAAEVLRAATENVTLTERALEEGEVSVTDVVVLRSAAVAAQLEHLEVLGEAYLAWFELAAAFNATPKELVGLIEVEN